MQGFLCIVSALFGGLSLLAAVSQIKSDKKATPALIMIAGALLLLVAVVCNRVGGRWDALLAFFGCAAVCAAALLNGLKSKQLHIQHHIIRIALSVILVAGFAVL